MIRGEVSDQDLEVLAQAWTDYWLLPPGSLARERLDWATDREFDMTFEDPEILWRLILAVHKKNQDAAIQQVLAAGPLENLLAQHGERFIARVEERAGQDPAFARLMGGIWKSTMTDSIWSRVQIVWDRRGWDGLPH